MLGRLLKNVFGKGKLRRNIIMILGIIIMGLGISIFKFSLMGNDPCNAFYMATADFVRIPYAFVAWGLNLIFFLVEIIWGRSFIGFGTFVNWFGVGVISTEFTKLINALFTLPESFWGRLPILIIGILVLSFSVSLYQTADVGIAPYDSVPIIISRKTKIPYFWCRIVEDGICAFLTWQLGGIGGLGTLVCAFGLGPFVTIFDKLVSRKLVGAENENSHTS